MEPAGNNEPPADPTSAAELGVEDEGSVRILTIQRPRRRNALSVELADALVAEIARAERDPAIGALVLCGEGGHFSAGGDAGSIVEAIEGPEGATIALMRSYQALLRAIWSSPLAVVAAVSGAAYGAAFNVVLGCDLIVCAPSARFCQVFLRRSLVPDVGGAFLLPRLVGLARAKAMMLLTPEIDAAQALELGLVNEIVAEGVDVRARAIELGAQLATLSPTAVALTKKLVNTSFGDLSSSLDLEALSQVVALSTPAARAGFEKFL